MLYLAEKVNQAKNMQTKQKILYIITQGEWGGAERYIYDLATSLGPNFDVIVAVGEPNGRRDLQEKLSKNGHINVVQLAHLVRRISLYHDLLALFELKRLYKQLQPYIIHLNSSKAGLLGSLARKYGIRGTGYGKIVYTIHGWIFNEPAHWVRKKLYFYLEKWTALLKDGFITLSSAEKNQGIKLLNIPAEKIVVIPHGMEAAGSSLSKSAARSELLRRIGLPIPEKNVWIGTIANYYHTKGLDILIQALALKKDALPNVCCLLIGEGPERKNLFDLISANKMEQKIFLMGTIEEAARLLPAFDLFVLPSRKEGLPYAILEALACSLPVIATDVGGVSSVIINKKNGLLVLPEDPGLLAETIDYAIKHLPEFVPSQLKVPVSLKEEIEKTTSWYRELAQQRY